VVRWAETRPVDGAKRGNIIVNEALTIRARHYRTQLPVNITMNDGAIAEIAPIGEDQLAPGEAEALPFAGPGLVDLQINGYMGYDFNDAPVEPATVVSATRELWKEGVTTYYPTITTNADANIESGMRAIASACEQDADCARSIAGIHLEGPFISPYDGPRGAHKADFVMAPDWSKFQRWQEASGGRIRMVTLSPEWPEAAEFIASCTASGVKAAIGHTAATTEQIHQAIEAGATMSTHFGNGAHLTLPRHPNYLWDQLASDDLWAGLIADGFHLPLSVLKVAMKAKGERALLVSDAVHLGGLPPGTYHSRKRTYVVKTPEGRIHLADHPGILSGSGQMLPWGIAHLTRNGLATMAQAWEMASIRPSNYMGLSTGAGMEAGALADVVLFEWENGGIRILRTYKHGKELPLE